MTGQEKQDLLKDVKEYLHITWDDEDEALEKIISRAIAFFKNIVGDKVDFVEDEDARQLLLDRCRYVRNYASEEFEDNFSSEITRLQFKYYVPSESDDDEAT